MTEKGYSRAFIDCRRLYSLIELTCGLHSYRKHTYRALRFAAEYISCVVYLQTLTLCQGWTLLLVTGGEPIEQNAR
jgi:hypothetical protein